MGQQGFCSRGSLCSELCCIGVWLSKSSKRADVYIVHMSMIAQCDVWLSKLEDKYPNQVSLKITWKPCKCAGRCSLMYDCLHTMYIYICVTVQSVCVTSGTNHAFDGMALYHVWSCLPTPCNLLRVSPLNFYHITASSVFFEISFLTFFQISSFLWPRTFRCI